MKRTPLKPGGKPLRRKKSIAERTAIARKARKPKRRKRSASEFARIYGSAERVRRIKALPCHVCGLYGSTENAHTENGGMGRKACWDTVVNLCSTHHRELHEYGVIDYVGRIVTMGELREWAAHLAREIKP